MFKVRFEAAMAALQGRGDLQRKGIPPIVVRLNFWLQSVLEIPQ
jgi:hypothetical protein